MKVSEMGRIGDGKTTRGREVKRVHRESRRLQGLGGENQGAESSTKKSEEEIDMG